MSQYITKIRTDQGDLQIDYNALANLPTISNPNLLINSDFRNPINQRGKTTYTANSDRTYTIDRWSIGNGTLTVNNSSITFTANSETSGSKYIAQLCEQKLSGTHVITFYCPVVIGEVYLIIRNGNDVNKDVPFVVTQGYNKCAFDHPLGSFNDIFFRLSASASLELEWIKLEQGTTATPFIPKLYAEEFMLCLRYYQAINCRLLMNIYTTERANGSYYFQTPMRAMPRSIVINSAQYFDTDTEQFIDAGATVANWGYLNNKYTLIRLDRNADDTFVIGRSLDVLIDMSIDAEIY